MSFFCWGYEVQAAALLKRLGGEATFTDEELHEIGRQISADELLPMTETREGATTFSLRVPPADGSGYVDRVTSHPFRNKITRTRVPLYMAWKQWRP